MNIRHGALIKEIDVWAVGAKEEEVGCFYTRTTEKAENMQALYVILHVNVSTLSWFDSDSVSSVQ